MLWPGDDGTELIFHLFLTDRVCAGYVCVCVLVFSLDRQAARSGHTMGTVVNIRFAHLFLPQTRTGPTHGRSCIGAESELVAAV